MSDEYTLTTEDVRAEYRKKYGRYPEPWRAPLGALRLTLAGDEPWRLERARAECEELVRVLNEVTPITDEQVEAACAGFYNNADGLTSWARLTRIERPLADRYRVFMRAALEAAAGVQS